jgi:hypothetical protein
MAKRVVPMEKEITISGYVEEIALPGGNVGVLINDGEADYYVVMDKAGKRLLEYIDEEVEATGVVTKSQGDWAIKVARFDVVDYYEDGDDEDYDYDDYDKMDDLWNR